MEQKAPKKKFMWQRALVLVFYLLMGIACGLLIGKYISQLLDTEQNLWVKLLSLATLLLWMYGSILLQIIIHEAGHLVFGLLSGYRFSSFRILHLIWTKDNDSGKIRFGRQTVTGTGGQCLLSPPELSGGKMPFVLYHLGGSLANAVSGLVFIGLSLVCTNIPLLSIALRLTAVAGFFLAVMNSLPLRLGEANNDGYNTLTLCRSPEALKAYWTQMKVNDEQTRGARLKDMPAEWFTVPTDAEMKNSMVAVIGVFACNRLMDAHRFDEADRLTSHLLEIDSGIVGLHRNLLICDRIYVELITENRRETLDGLLTGEQVKFMNAMRTFPSVLRTEYAYALLAEKDAAKADGVKARFEKCAKSYPYHSDILSERELMETAEQAAAAV